MWICAKGKIVGTSTNLETKIVGGCGVGVAAEVFVDDVLIFAGTCLEEEISRRSHRVGDCAWNYSTYVCRLKALLFVAWAFDQAISQCRRDKEEKEVDELHLYRRWKSVVNRSCRRKEAGK